MKYRRKKKWKFSETPLGRWLRYRPCITERYCPTCNQPYVEKPEPKPLKQFDSLSTAVLVYEGRRWGRKEYAVRVGRYRAYRDKLWLAQLLDPEDLDDLLKVVAEASEFLEQLQEGQRRKNRSANH